MALMLVIASSASAQRYDNVLTLPEQFINPYDYYAKPDIMRKFEVSDTKATSDKWVVYSDRDNNKLYDKPDGKVIPKKLDFMQPCFVVSKTNDGWLHLIKYDPYIITKSGTKISKDKAKTVEELGWIHRDNLLLWSRSLIDPESFVSRKAIIINVGEEGLKDVIKSQVGDTVQVYRTPDGKNKKAGPLVYDFYYILKKSGDYFLLSRYENFSPSTQESVIGWVSKYRVFPWDTRLVLEPNIYEAAYRERQAAPNFRAVHYKDHTFARKHASTGIKQSDGQIRIADPADLRDSSLVKTFSLDRTKSWDGKDKEKITMKRFEGEVLRFPILNMDKDKMYYATAVVGEIQVKDLEGKSKGVMLEAKYAAVERLAEEIKNASKNWNIVFLIEGSARLAPYKSQVLTAVDAIRDFANNLDSDIKVRSSAFIYRDIEDESEGKLIQELRKDSPDKIRSQLEGISFLSADMVGDDEVSAMYYGLEQAVNRGGFVDKQVNLLIHIGAFGDISTNPLRRRQDKNHKAMLDDERMAKLYEKLGGYMVHSLVLQVSDNEGRYSEEFLSGTFSTLLTTAQTAKNINSEWSMEDGLSFEISTNPSMKIPFETDYDSGFEARIPLMNSGISRGVLYTPGKGKSMVPDDFSKQIGQFLNNIRLWVLGKNTGVTGFSEGRAIDEIELDFQETVIQELRTSLGNVFSKADFEKLRFQKFRLMLPSYVPVKVAGMQHDLHSYVVLMDGKGLQEHVNRLEELSLVLESDPSVLRERLFTTLFGQCSESYLAERRLSRDAFKKMSYGDFSRLINGIKEEGVELKFPVNWKMEDIMKDRVVTDEAIKRYAVHISSSLSIMRDKIQRGNYPYKFTRNGVEYFWIPVDFTL